MALNLERQMVFYGQYHHDPTNVIIHMTFVPLILATGILLATNSPNLLPLPSFLSVSVLPPNLGVIASFFYVSTYVLLEPVAGLLIAPFIIGCAALGNFLTTYHTSTANFYAIVLHVMSWIAQFIGHGKFEGRAPALLDNLVQALVLAPMFVWLEFLFKFGYRPELQSRINQEIDVEVKKFKAGQVGIDDEKEKKKSK